MVKEIWKLTRLLSLTTLKWEMLGVVGPRRVRGEGDPKEILLECLELQMVKEVTNQRQ